MMKTFVTAIVLLGACGQDAVEATPALQACDAYDECVESVSLTEEERNWVQWERESTDRCFEFEDDPSACERQCLVDYADFVRSRPPESGCDPLATLHGQRYVGRAYPKPGVEDAGEFDFSLVVVGVTSTTVTLEIGEVDGEAPAVVGCPREGPAGFVCNSVSGRRGETVLAGALRERDTDLTGEFVLTEDDSTVVEWWFTASLND